MALKDTIDGEDVLMVIGASLITVGFTMWNVAAGVIIAGVSVIVLTIAATKP